jgi:hypothetical protein
VEARQREQRFEGGFALPGLQARQGAEGDPGGLAEPGQRDAAFLAQCPQARTHGGQDGREVAVCGVWVAGNVTAFLDTVIGAAAGGVRAAAAINTDLDEEDTRRAVEARRGTHEDYWDARYRQSERIWSGDPDEAAAVAPGGVLLVVGHAGFPSWAHHHAPDLHLPTTDEVLESLELPAGQWEVLLSGEHERTQTTPDGRPGTRTDNTLKVRRLSPPPSR